MANKSSFLRQELKRLQPLMTDDLVEIDINADGQVWFENRGDIHMRLAEFKVDENYMRELATQITTNANEPMSKNNPVISVSLEFDEWLIRALVVAPPAIRKGYSISIRFHKIHTELIKPSFLYGEPRSAAKERLARNNKIREFTNSGQLDKALEFCVSQKLNTIVSGGTNTGKTTVARYLQSLVSNTERIITIESGPDLLPTQPNTVTLISLEDDKNRQSHQLLRACMRMRPDRICLSEIIGAEAYTFIKAINTGHGGSLTTLHADTAQLAIDRMTQLCLETTTGMNFEQMKDHIEKSIDLVIHVGRDGKSRGIVEMYLPGQ
ncbi:MAG: Flp pilus assembly complex ATPase component TadA [Rhizobiales bacterium]|nr:Flp pilus assembly complex ATPase component TadA [Hyphomicrobiales bacterium]